MSARRGAAWSDAGRYVGAAAFLAVLLGFERSALAQLEGDALFDRLSWLLILPVGVVQFVIARWMQKNFEARFAPLTALATGVAFLLGLVCALTADTHSVRDLMIVLFFVPGVPTFVRLARLRQWQLAVFFFILPPAPLVVFGR